MAALKILGGLGVFVALSAVWGLLWLGVMWLFS